MLKTFTKFLKDPHPPKFVFVVYNGDVRSMLLSNLSNYKYTVTGTDNFFDLPIVTKG